MDVLGPDNAFWIEGEWLSWDAIPDLDAEETRVLARLEYESALRRQFPNADPTLVRHFQKLLALAKEYFWDTRKHLQVYGDIGELFGAITFGIKLHDQYAQGSDGRLGNHFVEIKTITPFKRRDSVTVKLDGHFSKLLVVKINANFEVSGRLVDRWSLSTRKSGSLIVSWDMLQRTK